MLINTIHGQMEESDLIKEIKVYEDDNELTQCIEYTLNEELVHRSVHVQLKKQVEGSLDAAEF